MKTRYEIKPRQNQEVVAYIVAKPAKETRMKPMIVSTGIYGIYDGNGWLSHIQNGNAQFDGVYYLDLEYTTGANINTIARNGVKSLVWNFNHIRNPKCELDVIFIDANIHRELFSKNFSDALFNQGALFNKIKDEVDSFVNWGKEYPDFPFDFDSSEFHRLGQFADLAPVKKVICQAMKQEGYSEYLTGLAYSNAILSK